MIKVLIIEDHKVTRDGLRSALQEFTELEISGATADSVSGLRLAEELQPDVVLLDLHLPGPLGPRNLVEKMKSSVNAKIVVFSAENRAVIIRAVLDAKADAFVYKAAEPQEIYSAIKDVMEGTVGGRYGVVEDPTCEPVFTAGERHILSLMARGKKYQEIAQIRFTQAETVRKQVEDLQNKLSIRTREKLIAWAVDNGFGVIDVDV